MALVAPFVASLPACSPDICGDVAIHGVATNSTIEQYRQSDGSIGLAELCGTSYGAFAQSRADLAMTTLVLDADVGDNDDEGGYAITDVVLPAASVVFWDAHLVAGATITFQQMAGGGLHKASAGATYDVYPLSAGTITVLSGGDRETDTFDGETHWTEQWRLRWSLDFGSPIRQHWEGEDSVTRRDGSTIGTPAYYPPDPMP